MAYLEDEEQRRIFSDNLQKYVNRSGKTQKDIAIDLDVNPPTFSMWIKGKSMPSVSVIRRIADYFGISLENEVRNHINKYYLGEQSVGTSFMIDIPNTNKKLIHTPTMRLPSPIKEPLIIYQCMRETLICAFSHLVFSIVIPAFGGATGKVKPDVIAKYMKAGYKQVFEFIFGRIL